MNERKKLIEQLRLDYTASNMALALMKQAADMLEADVNWEQVPKPPLPRAGIKAIGVDEKPFRAWAQFKTAMRFNAKVRGEE